MIAKSPLQPSMNRDAVINMDALSAPVTLPTTPTQKYQQGIIVERSFFSPETDLSGSDFSTRFQRSHSDPASAVELVDRSQHGSNGIDSSGIEVAGVRFHTETPPEYVQSDSNATLPRRHSDSAPSTTVTQPPSSSSNCNSTMSSPPLSTQSTVRHLNQQDQDANTKPEQIEDTLERSKINQESVSSLNGTPIGTPILKPQSADVPPLTSTSELIDNSTVAASTPAFNLKNVNILVVDDAPINIKILVRMLENYSVTVCTNGLEAIEAVEKKISEMKEKSNEQHNDEMNNGSNNHKPLKHFDVILSDVIMPKCDVSEKTKNMINIINTIYI